MVIKKSFFGKQWKLILFLIVVVSGLIYFYFKNPAEGFYPPCPFLYFTGFYCPGCGSSRALHQLLHLNIARAFGFNPLMVISIPFVLYLLIAHFDIKVKGRSILRRIPFNKRFYIVMIFVFIGYGVIRNIPCFPFTLLAP